MVHAEKGYPMNKYLITYTIRGAIHRPFYEGKTEVWINYPTEASRAVYDKLRRTGMWYDLDPTDIKVKTIEYLTMLD